MVEIGQKIKLNEIGLKRVFNNDLKLTEQYKNVDAIIKEILSSEGFYIAHYPDGYIVSIIEGEFISSYEPKNDGSGKGYFETMATEIGRLVDLKQIAYGNSVDKTYRLMQIYLEKWKNENNTYTIPDSLLRHILLMVRLIDKQNRIFNNPDGDLMQENPYQDSVGYDLLGVRMMDNNPKK